MNALFGASGPYRSMNVAYAFSRTYCTSDNNSFVNSNNFSQS